MMLIWKYGPDVQLVCEWNFTHMGSDGSDLRHTELRCFVRCVCVSLVFCWIPLSKQVERPVVMRDTAVVWEDMREDDHSEKENAL